MPHCVSLMDVVIGPGGVGCADIFEIKHTSAAKKNRVFFIGLGLVDWGNQDVTANLMYQH